MKPVECVCIWVDMLNGSRLQKRGIGVLVQFHSLVCVMMYTIYTSLNPIPCLEMRLVYILDLVSSPCSMGMRLPLLHAHSLVPRPSSQANAVEGLVKLLRKMMSWGH